MKERKTLCYTDTAFQTAPQELLLSYQREHGELQKQNPGILAGSSGEQPPSASQDPPELRKPYQQPLPQRNVPGTLVPNAALSDSPAAGLPPRHLLPRSRRAHRGQHETMRRLSVPVQETKLIQQPGSFPITALIHC